MTMPNFDQHNVVISIAFGEFGKTKDDFFKVIALLESWAVRCIGLVAFDAPVNKALVAATDWGRDPAWLAAQFKDDPHVEILPGPQFFTACQAFGKQLDDGTAPNLVKVQPLEPGLE